MVKVRSAGCNAVKVYNTTVSKVSSPAKKYHPTCVTTCPGWRRGIVVIAFAYRTEDPVFKSRQGVRFLGIYTVQCSCHNLICIVIVCNLEN
jgi:hypothetical protein